MKVIALITDLFKWYPEEIIDDLKGDMARRTVANINKLVVDAAHVVRWLGLLQNPLSLENLRESGDVCNHPDELVSHHSKNDIDFLVSKGHRQEVATQFRNLLLDGILTSKERIIVTLLHGIGYQREMTKTELEPIIGLDRTTIEYHETKALQKLSRDPRVKALYASLNDGGG